jgi:hypothetical protein
MTAGSKSPQVPGLSLSYSLLLATMVALALILGAMTGRIERPTVGPAPTAPATVTSTPSATTR